MIIGYNKAQNQYYIDRTKSGKTDFQKDFGKKHTAPRFVKKGKMDVTPFIDDSSVELFADNGSTVMTAVCFSNKPYHHIYLQSDDKVLINKLTYAGLKSLAINYFQYPVPYCVETIVDIQSLGCC